MKNRTFHSTLFSVFVLGILATLNAPLTTLLAQGTAFTYQGRLTDGGSAANGNYDLQFTVKDALTAGGTVGSPVVVAPVGVSNGLFAVTLDFGAGIFPGAGRWLETGVRTNGSVAAYTVLTPRQPVSSTPYAVQAASAGTVTGVIADGQLSTNVAKLNGSPIFTGTVTSGGFSGNGASVTNVNAATLGGLAAASFWTVAGNGGTVPGTQFLGTTDNQALEFKVFGSRALRLEPNGTSPNVIGGYAGNSIASGTVGSTISGGGASANTNSISANNSVIGGGSSHSIQTGSVSSTIGGGYGNMIQSNAYYSTVSGGVLNLIQTNSTYATVGGGGFNVIQGNAPDATIAGGDANTIQAGANDSTIGGGTGNTIQTNAAYSTIGGGFQNIVQTNVQHGVIGGGAVNTIQNNGSDSTIGGGSQNAIQINAYNSTIGGGYVNTIQTNAANSTIGGGSQNTIQSNASFTTLGGGYGNTIQNEARYSTIGGGNANTLQTNVNYGTIAGGNGNTIQTNANNATIAGGSGNVIQINAFVATIGGGSANTIQTSSVNATISGGFSNTSLTNANYSTISGGNHNTNLNNALYAVIPGGRLNIAAAYAFASGYNAQATNVGAFVWSDGSGTQTASTNDNSVTMRAGGGFRFFTSAASVGASLAAGGTSWATISDRNAKKNFQPLDATDVLRKLSAMPVQHWNYKWETDDAVPHIGPMAQDFKAAFYPGRDDKSITTLEFDGVELAAIQGLNQKLNQKDAEIKNLTKQNDSLATRLNELESMVRALAEKK